MVKQKPRMNTRSLVMTAMLAAVSYILMFLDFNVPFMPSFIRMDISEMPALIGSFSLGPVYGVIICLIKNLINTFLRSTTGGIGELSNFLLGVMFVVPAGLVYKHKKTKKTALIGSLVGAACMAVGSVFTNIFLVYPIYYNFMPKESILAAYQAIIPAMKSVEQSIICFNLPFTFVKGLLCTLVTVIVYKRISRFIKGNY